MQRHTGERGAALILLIGITAALAILAAAAVMVLANQQGATASDRSDKSSMDYAEAGLDSAITAVKNKTFSTTSTTPQWVTPSEMAAGYVAAYPLGPALTAVVYDNQGTVVPSIAWDQGQPTAATTPDGKVWVEVQVTYQGQTTRLREMVSEVTALEVTGFPQAAVYSDGNINASGGTGDLYAVNPDGTPDTSAYPYQTSIMARGNFTGNSQTNLAAPGSTVQSLGINVNGTVNLPGINETPPVFGGVKLLSDYFNQATQNALAVEAQTGSPTQANPNGDGTVYTSQSALLSAPGVTYDSTTKTYTATVDLVFDGDLSLSSGTTYNFRSLYVNGSLTLNGNQNTNTTALYVRDDFTISGSTGPSKFGPIYVGGRVDWRGGSVANPLSVQTTDYLDASKAPGPLYVGTYFSAKGVYNHVLGPTWVVGNAGTSDVAIEFRPTSASTIMCPLMATTEKIETSGPCTFGSMTQPMVLYMVCDNDNLYSNTMEWGSTGTFYGLMVVMEAQVRLTGGNTGPPNIVGALFCAFDVTITANTSVCYNQTVIDNVTQSAITEITTTRDTVPGTWQELSAN